MAKFPNSPNYTGLHAPSRLEADAGPLATAKLGIRLRGGLHGNWTPADQLPKTDATVKLT